MFRRAMVKMVKLLQTQSLHYISLSKQVKPVCSCIVNTNIRPFSVTIHLPIAENKIKTCRNGFDQRKAKIILSLNFKSAEDSLPFYQLPIETLQFIQKATINDAKNGFCENRLYYLSSKIKCPPAVLSEKLAKRNFVYGLSFDWLEKSLNELLDKGVSGDRIIRDLWVLKYNYVTIRERLQNIKDMGIEKLFPWMVRCSPEILDRYMKSTKETKSILGDSKSTQMYLAKRLNISIEDVEAMCIKMPALKTIRVTKVKKFLDFLIAEGYDEEEIVTKSRILAASQETVSNRLKELRQLGLTHVNLNILCRSRKDYRKFYDNLEIGNKYNKT